MSLVAICKTLNAGFPYQKYLLESLGIEVGDTLTVESIDMGECSTAVKIVEYPNHTFNSVFFNFEKDGKPHDIFADPEYNPYLPRSRDVIPETTISGKPWRGKIVDAAIIRNMVFGDIEYSNYYPRGIDIRTSAVQNITPIHDCMYEVETRNSVYWVVFMDGIEGWNG